MFSIGGELTFSSFLSPDCIHLSMFILKFIPLRKSGSVLNTYLVFIVYRSVHIHSLTEHYVHLYAYHMHSVHFIHTVCTLAISCQFIYFVQSV